MALSTFQFHTPCLCTRVIFTYFVTYVTYLFLFKTFKALSGFLCADVLLINYSLTHSAPPCIAPPPHL